MRSLSLVLDLICVLVLFALRVDDSDKSSQDTVKHPADRVTSVTTYFCCPESSARAVRFRHRLRSPVIHE